MVSIVITLAGLGALAGFLAGLLGVGGGIVLVPGLYYCFTAFGFPPDIVMHMAVGTSLAVIVPTGLSSARAHQKRGALDTALLYRIGAGILVGVCAGTVIASFMDGQDLKAVFAVTIIGLALIMALNPAARLPSRPEPSLPAHLCAGGGIGTLSTLVGIGGATLSVPYMSIGGVDMRKAIGTASALGLVIAIPGTAGFMLIGTGVDGRPPYSIGYINALAWAVIVPLSVMMAPQGARLAHAVPVRHMRTGFAVFMFLIAAKMLHGAYNGTAF